MKLGRRFKLPWVIEGLRGGTRAISRGADGRLRVGTKGWKMGTEPSKTRFKPAGLAEEGKEKPREGSGLQLWQFDHTMLFRGTSSSCSDIHVPSCLTPLPTACIFSVKSGCVTGCAKNRDSRQPGGVTEDEMNVRTQLG